MQHVWPHSSLQQTKTSTRCFPNVQLQHIKHGLHLGGEAFRRLTPGNRGQPWVGAPLPGNVRAKAGAYQQELNDAVQLTREACCNLCSRVLKVVILSSHYIANGVVVKGIVHRTSLARSCYMASSPSIQCARPAAISASRSSASCAQAASTSGSVSRLRLIA